MHLCRFMPMKSALRSGRLEIELADAVRGVDDGIDPAFSRHGRNLGDGEHEAGAMAEMRQRAPSSAFGLASNAVR